MFSLRFISHDCEFKNYIYIPAHKLGTHVYVCACFYIYKKLRSSIFNVTTFHPFLSLSRTSAPQHEQVFRVTAEKVNHRS